MTSPASTSAPNQSGAPDPFVGRSAELARLEGLLEQADQGVGSLVLITGEAGMGKTALTSEFIRRLRTRDVSVNLIRGRCVEHYGTAAAYLPFLDGLGKILLSPGRERLTDLLRTYAPTWYVQLPALAAGSDAQKALQRETVGATKQRMLRELGDVIEATTAASVMVGLLEDVQWADPSSAELIAHLANRLRRQRFVIMATLRPGDLEAPDHPLRGLVQKLRAQPGSHEIALSPFDPASVKAYLDAAFPGNGFPPELSLLIHRTTDGHPLFVASFTKLLQERGDIAADGTRWVLKEGVLDSAFDAPESVRGIVHSKLQSLNEADRATLQYGAVMGREFLSTVLASVLEVDEIELEERLLELDRVHRLIDTVREEELPSGTLSTRYRFTNGLYQGVIYDDLVSKRRVLMHQRIAGELVRQYGREAPRIAALLAHHYEKGREFGHAITYLAHAGDAAARLCANAEAAEYYSRALSLAERLPPENQAPQKVLLFQRLGATQFAMGQFNLAVSTFTGMIENARAIQDPLRECAGMDGLCRSLFFAHRSDEAAVRAAEALDAAERSGRPIARIDSLLAVVLILLETGELSECRALLDEIVSEARRLGHERALVAALAYGGALRSWQGEYAEAGPRLTEALRLATQLRDGFYTQTALLFQGLTHLGLGKISDALSCLDEGMAMARRNSDPFWLSRTALYRGPLYLALQDLDGAIARDQETLEIARAENTEAIRASALLNLTFDYTQAGRFDDAATALETAEAIPDREYRWMHETRLASAQTLLLRARRDIARAEEQANRLLELAIQHGARGYMVAAHTLLAEFQMGHNIDSAEGHVSDALAELNRYPSPLLAWKTQAVRSRLCLLREDHVGAQAAAREAISIVEQIAKNTADDSLRATFQNSSVVRELSKAAAH